MNVATSRIPRPRRTVHLAIGVTTGVLAVSMLAGCAVPVYQTRSVYDASTVARAVPAYPRIGTIDRIEAVDTRYGSSGGGAVLGAVIGGVLGSRFGGGFGRSAAAAAGVVGGAIIGDQSERAQAAAASGRNYRVFVRYDDGGLQRFIVPDIGSLRAGERVSYQNGALAPV